MNAPELSAAELCQYWSRTNITQYRVELPVLDCDCKVSYNNAAQVVSCKCKLPPCAVSAFKQLQTQMLSHRSDISALKGTIEQIQVAATSPKPVAERATDIEPPRPIVSSTLQADVKRWLVSQRDGALLL